MSKVNSNFSHSLAIAIGVNKYANGIAPLRTATHDAQALAQLLKSEHGYDVHLLLDESATKQGLLHWLSDRLPQLVTPDDRVLFYFAGHGVAIDGDDGPAGYLVPQDAKPGDDTSFLPMQVLHDALTALPCRHSLIILDCCFSGAFRWSSTRDIAAHPEVIYKERFDRFLRSPAWQVITSAAYDQTAFDILQDHRGHGHTGNHSPFAEALFDALRGQADRFPIAAGGLASGDGVITATELYLYLRDRVELATEAIDQYQTPGLWPLRKHDKGEYIFLVPGHELNLPPAPELSTANNPYRGLESFDEAQAHLYFGRGQLIEELQTFVLEHPLTVVLGPSGTGKSSLVKAGLIPALRQSDDADWQILPPIRPGDAPLKALAQAILSLSLDKEAQTANVDDLAENLAQDSRELTRRVMAWGDRFPHKRLLLVVDQFEELMTQCRSERERQQFLQLLQKALRLGKNRGRIVLTLRSDFEPQFQSWLTDIWMQSRFLVKPMTQDELRQAIEAPAAERVMVFEPYSLVDKLINEVVQMPGALPLLSFTLSELYLKYLQRQDGDRALTQTDYEALGGVAGSLTQRATQEYEVLKQQDPAYEHTMKRVMLRMVAIEGGELARRRVLRSELVYPDDAENTRVEVVIQRLITARLIVKGQDPGGEAYVEPAHDALVQGWNQLQRWKNEEQENLSLQRLLTPAAREWADNREGKKSTGFLWNNNPRLDLLLADLKSSQSWLNQLERQFVNQSQNRRRNNSMRLAGFLLTVFLALSGATGIAFFQRAEAQRQSGIAQQSADEAEQQRQQAEANAARAKRNADEAEQQRQQAEEQQQRAEAGEAEAQKQSEIAQKQTRVAQQQTRRAEQQTLLAQQQTRIAEQEKAGSERKSANSEVLAQSLIAESQFKSGLQIEGLLIGLETARSVQAKGGLIEDDKVMQTAAILQNAVYSIQEKNRYQDHSDWIYSISFSPDGQTLASASKDGTVKLWDRNGRELRTLHHADAVYEVSFSPDGQTLASASKDSTVKLWDRNGHELHTLHHASTVYEVSFSPDGKTLASASGDGTVKLWDRDGQELRTLQHSNYVYAVAFSPDGKTIASLSSGDVTLWNADGRKLRTFQASSGSPANSANFYDVHGVSFSPDGQTIAITSSNSTVELWDVNGSELPTLQHPRPYFIHSVNFSPDGSTIATASSDGTLTLWDKSGHKSQTLWHSDATLLDVRFSPDGQTIASASSDGTVKLWNQDHRKLKTLSPYGGSVFSISFSPNGQLLASANRQGILKLWDVNSRQQRVLWKSGAALLSVSFSPDGQIIAGSNSNGTIKLWDKDGQELKNFLHSRYVYSVGFSPDSQTIVSASSDGTVKLWDLQGRELQTLQHSDVVHSANFSPDGQNLATASGDGIIKLWTREGRALQTLQGHADAVYRVKFSPDGQILASASGDGTVKLWDMEGRELKALQGHSGAVNDLSFSPSGQILASASSDGTVKLWNKEGRELQTLQSNADFIHSVVHSVSFSPDGQTLASSGSDVPIVLWNFNLDDLTDKGCDWLQNYLSNPATPPEHKALCQNNLPELAASSQPTTLGWQNPIASVFMGVTRAFSR
ncbi:caspase family protein [Halomicronema sp. CCY15110]|uniref:nSTAND1 domain-containing NTPase n=1 Tax=Halomicronema sp. CCY15110 TaxID=2767773 RepID=UPI0019522607|nr:caspase family protein [Halomicronema sp. CCY15110]